MAILAAFHPNALLAQYSYWTGYGDGWEGQTLPANNGTANLYFSDSIYPFVTLSSSLNDVNSITLAQGNNFTFAGTTTLTLVSSGINGIATADNIPGDLYFGTGINLAISGPTVYNSGNNAIYITGQVTGTGSLTLSSAWSGAASTGAFIFNNTGAGNTYTGPTTIGDGTNFVAVAFWNSSPFGPNTNTVTFDGGQLIAHGTQTISNPLIINFVASANAEIFKSWDAPLTIAGAVTLDNNATLAFRTATTAIAAPLNNGSVPLPGPLVSNPVIFTGGISGSHQLTFQGQGVAILDNGSDTYTGGTNVGSGGSAGTLVFATAASVPSSGSIVVASNGYLGSADPTLLFSTLFSHLNESTALGSYGVDTLPGNPTTNYGGAINLSGFTNVVDIGSATSGIVSGTITPQSTAAYRFGGGGGTLYVNTPLTNAGTNVVVTDPGNSLSLLVYLQGNNSYPGTTMVNDGMLIFDGANSLPVVAANKIVDQGSLTNVGASYVGYTANAGITETQFLSSFDKTNTWGIVGFDNQSGAVNGVDLTGFNDGVFIGTVTAATLTGTLTPSSVTNGSNAANTLRFTALESGVLTVNSSITGGVSVMLGSPSQFGQFSSGKVVMNGANTYSGGTTLNAGNTAGLTVALGSSTALGTGGVTITQPSTAPQGLALIGLQAATGGINLTNPITFQDTGSNNSARLYLTGANNFTLSGNLTGDSWSSIILDNASPITVTLSGSNNSGFAGTYSVYNGTLVFPSAGSLGSGTLDFEGAGTVDLSSAVNPLIQTISGAQNNGALGTLILPASGALTFDTTNDTGSSNDTFGGTITGTGGLTVNDNTGASGAIVLLFGNNTYSGGTTVTNYGSLAVASSSALGTGPVTVSGAGAGKGGLALDTGVTLTNALTFNSGYLAGDGTFNPSGAGLGGTITIGSNQALAGGLPFSNNGVVAGTLSFAGNLAFNNGGIYYWTLQDSGRSDGISQIHAAGNVTIGATAGGFTIEAVTYDANGIKGNAPSNFSLSSPASWTILTTGGSITGFNASDFTIDPSKFDTGNGITSSNFSLTVNGGDQLVLNFTPVPEPSTWALLGIGVGAIGLAGFRRRRIAGAA